MPNQTRALAVACFVALVAMAACGPSEEQQRTTAAPGTEAAPTAAPSTFPSPGGVRAATIELGRSVNPDKTMHDATVIFKPDNTIYASVILEGESPGVSVTGRFTRDDGKVLQETGEKVSVPARAVVEFHVPPPGGWAVGQYLFEVQIEGVLAGKKSYQVEP